MYDAVLTFCNGNAAIITTVPAFVTALASFQTTFDDLQTAAQAEIQAIAGVTIDKAEQRKTLVELATDMAASIFAFASATDNFILKEQVNLTFSDFNRLKDELLTPACQNVLDAANANSAALVVYGVTAAKITAFSTAITDYATAVPGPRNAVAQRSSAGTTIKELFKTGDEILKEQMDKLALQFKTANPEFYNTYKNNRIILDAATSATQVSGQVTVATDTAGISGATVTAEGTSYNSISNLNGDYTLKIPVPGTYNIIFTHPDYQTKTIANVVVTLGQSTKLNTELQPLP